MQVAAVIPARMDSTRYPGKPLCDIRGLPMVEHVYRRCQLSPSVDETYVATPDSEIRDATESFGGEAIDTGVHKRGTDRVAEAAESFDADIIVAVHVDEPLITPEMIDEAVSAVQEREDVGVANLGRPIRDEQIHRDPNSIKIVVDESGAALYFTRAPIPYLRSTGYGSVPVFHQVCVVPFERELLRKYTQLEETPLEAAESIDMLRLLEHGHPVHVVETDRETYSIDSPEDHERVSERMAADDVFVRYDS
ncbi:3-deoxy-manno-octulosonate cytidylyltransferase [Natrinema halophilum]|uniref:3-deoxy-manno-octulosonate cytidylyltransferase n=1 Tax=Natrinema halophilum TaxID=1699371 RepID=A0A7D5GQM0_9EURY|nr:3-deoxy-manno-octulosonate cytidylyltransferase [Natrinema halophilum]QLG47849.1 3-deoxy-manno-octulosonate cytidylyltransferase [Natrinema halophilum]